MFRRYTLHLLVLTLAALALIAVACDESETRPDPATPTPPPDPRRTGIEIVDKAIDAVEARDQESFAQLILILPEPCERPAMGSGGPPACEPGETPGQLVGVVPFASCEGYWVRKEGIGPSLARLFEGQVRLYAVFEDGMPLFHRTGEYTLVFEDTGRPEGPLAYAVVMTHEGVIGVNYACGQNPEQFLLYSDLDNPIVEPPDVRTQ